ncbi:OmpA family protein [Terrimonas alba]|uniref:OmpA family protein n=1 Tax=Terrimonas alba TaxID=3349636 RepID=UPI0035F3EC98
MKRISLVVALSFLCFLFSNAQLRVGILGGFHQSKVIEDNNIPGWDTIKNNFSNRNGAHFGFIADLRFNDRSNFYFQPGVIFFTKGRNYKNSPSDSTVVFKRPLLSDSVVNTVYYETRKQFVNYIDLPLNIVYKIKLAKKINFILGGGPYISFFYDGFDKKENVLVDVRLTTDENDDLPIGKGSGKYAIFNYGVNALAGFEFGRVFLTANYSRGLNDFYKPTDYTATNYKHEVMGATLGIFLGKQVPLVPKDKDGDGTPDKTDKCPDIAGPAKLLGCPDTDNDGIQDSDDKCAGEAGPVENNGCPYLDKDNDGVLDKDDQCPDIAGPKDNAGCPYADTDKDGISDKEDKCPEQAGLGRYQGCPIPDTDGDGINDEEDKCPDVKGVAERNGCPEEIKKEIVEKVEYAAKRIQFKVNSAELQSGSFKVLDEVANILKDNPDIKVAIEGHTSSEGRYEVNMRLSEKRANTVKDYLKSKGIDSSRLTAIGFGADRPLNPGKTPAERAENRRVELKLSNQ